MKDISFITQSSPAFIESIYKEFEKNPESVDLEFRKFFEGFDFAIQNQPANLKTNAEANIKN